MSRTSADAVSIHAVLPESSANSDIAIEIHSSLASRAAGSRPTLGPGSYVQSPLVLQPCDKEAAKVNVAFRPQAERARLTIRADPPRTRPDRTVPGRPGPHRGRRA